MSDPFSILELRRQSGARARRAHRWRLLLVIGVILLVGLGMVAVAFIAPPFVKRHLEHRLADALQREVTIRDLQLNPWVLSTTIDGLAINDRDGRLLFGCERLYVRFGFWSLFSGPWNLKKVSVTAPTARLEINRDGTLNISDLLAPPAEISPAPGKPHPIRIGQLAVSQARFTFADHSRAQDFSTELGPLGFSLENFSTVPVAPGAPYEFTASTESGETLHWRGTFSADPLRSIGGFELGSIALKKYALYFAGVVRGEILAGTLDAAGRYEIDLSARPCVIRIGAGELRLHGLQLAPAGTATPVIDLPETDLTGLEASLAPLKVSASKLDLAGGSIALHRDAAGTCNLATIFVIPAGSPTSPVSPDVSLGLLEVHGLGLTFDDALASRPAHFAMAFDLLAQGISLAPGAPPAPLELAARLSPQGVLALKGSFALAPCRASLAVELTDYPLAGAGPYLAPRLNLRITGGTVSARGQLAVAVPAEAAPQVVFRGDAEVDRCSTVDGGSGEEFVSFASLGFRQLDFTSEPFALAVGQVSLIEPSLHFALYRDGSTNLDTVFRRAAPGNPEAMISSPVLSPDQPSAASHPSSGVSPISIDRVVLANGSLTFTDRSIEPNTSFTVDDLAGLVSGLSSEERTRATIDLRAKVDDSSPVAVTGQVNFFNSDAFADLTAGCTDIDLQPASPYCSKYAGYALGRGSLSLDLKVHLDQRHLDSLNIITLNQFTLGEKTNSPDATNLPVRFAVALLKDTSGKIVLNLPIQGSLDDPALPIARVVFQAVANILVKATTDPFSLLGSMFGGANQSLDHIDFAPGASELATKEMKKLDVVARALVARPGLNLEVAGDADVDGDTPSLQRIKLKQLLRAKIWESRHSEDPGLPPVDQIEISNDELDRALVTLYSHTFAPGSRPGAGRAAAAHAQEGPMLFPRNPLSFSSPTTGGPSLADAGKGADTPESAASDLPPPAALSLQDMVARLAPRQRVTDSDISQLAADRAQHVKDYLVEQGVPAERMLFADSAVGSSTRVRLQLK